MLVEDLSRLVCTSLDGFVSPPSTWPTPLNDSMLLGSLNKVLLLSETYKVNSNRYILHKYVLVI